METKRKELKTEKLAKRKAGKSSLGQKKYYGMELLTSVVSDIYLFSIFTCEMLSLLPHKCIFEKKCIYINIFDTFTVIAIPPRLKQLTDLCK